MLDSSSFKELGMWAFYLTTDLCVDLVALVLKTAKVARHKIGVELS